MCVLGECSLHFLKTKKKKKNVFHHIFGKAVLTLAKLGDNL